MIYIRGQNFSGIKRVTLLLESLPETDVVEENEQFDEVELHEPIDPGEAFADDSSDDDGVIIDEEVLDAQDSESDIWLSSITIGKDEINSRAKPEIYCYDRVD